jgi:hypothetical protein
MQKSPTTAVTNAPAATTITVEATTTASTAVTAPAAIIATVATTAPVVLSKYYCWKNRRGVFTNEVSLHRISVQQLFCS